MDDEQVIFQSKRLAFQIYLWNLLGEKCCVEFKDRLRISTKNENYSVVLTYTRVKT